MGLRDTIEEGARAVGGLFRRLADSVTGGRTEELFTAANNDPELSAEGRLFARRMAFVAGVVGLAAKLSKLDGHVSRDEIVALKSAFRIPAEETEDMARFFREAKEAPEDWRPLARQIVDVFGRGRVALEDVLDGLALVACADGHLTAEEERFILDVALEFGISRETVQRIIAFRALSVKRDTRKDDDRTMPPEEDDLAASYERLKALKGAVDSGQKTKLLARPAWLVEVEASYRVLGVEPGASEAEVEEAWKRLVKENHPDQAIARGMPEEMLAIATGRIAAINAARDRIRVARGWE